MQQAKQVRWLYKWIINALMKCLVEPPPFTSWNCPPHLLVRRNIWSHGKGASLLTKVTKVTCEYWIVDTASAVSAHSIFSIIWPYKHPTYVPEYTGNHSPACAERIQKASVQKHTHRGPHITSIRQQDQCELSWHTSPRWHNIGNLCHCYIT